MDRYATAVSNDADIGIKPVKFTILSSHSHNFCDVFANDIKF